MGAVYGSLGKVRKRGAIGARLRGEGEAKSRRLCKAEFKRARGNRPWGPIGRTLPASAC